MLSEYEVVYFHTDIFALLHMVANVILKWQCSKVNFIDS